MVTADGIAEGVPSVVSMAIDWAPEHWKADVDDVLDIARAGRQLLNDGRATADGWKALVGFNQHGVNAYQKLSQLTDSCQVHKFTGHAARRVLSGAQRDLWPVLDSDGLVTRRSRAGVRSFLVALPPVLPGGGRSFSGRCSAAAKEFFRFWLWVVEVASPATSCPSSAHRWGPVRSGHRTLDGGGRLSVPRRSVSGRARVTAFSAGRGWWPLPAEDRKAASATSGRVWPACLTVSPSHPGRLPASHTFFDASNLSVQIRKTPVDTIGIRSSESEPAGN